MTLEPVARVENDFPTKFGLPRQSGLGGKLLSRVVMEKTYAREDYLRGLTEFSHIWLLWGFEVPPIKRATVRPPKLGGNERRGVFATRSPFRPNPLGLTVVKLENVDITPEGACLTVSGGDMKSGTVVYDIKPYIPYADSVPAACGGFADAHARDRLRVVFPDKLKDLLPADKLPGLIEALSLDPRPSYQDDPGRVYGFFYAGKDIRFRAENGIIYVVEVKGE